MKRLFLNIGKSITEQSSDLGRGAFRNLGSFVSSIWEGLHGPYKFYFSEFVYFSSSSGVNAFGIVAITSAVAGVTSSYLIAEEVRRAGVGAEFMGGGVTQMLVTQLVPILVGLVVAGRTGSAITASIGTMKITEQIEALKSISTDPIQFLFFPRLIGLMVALPCLTILGCVMGNIAGYFAAERVLHLSWSTWTFSILDLFEIEKLFHSIYKSVIFGAIITIVSFYQGWTVHQSSEELSRRIQIGVVGSMTFILIANLIMTVLVF